MQTHKLKWDYQSAMYRRVVVFRECGEIETCSWGYMFFECDPDLGPPAFSSFHLLRTKFMRGYDHHVELTGATWCTPLPWRLFDHECENVNHD